jgi:hypothetical protein
MTIKTYSQHDKSKMIYAKDSMFNIIIKMIATMDDSRYQLINEGKLPRPCIQYCL